MITQYIQKLIDNLPDKYQTQKTPIKMDIILDGGLFNGSYLIGVCLFLKEMEKRKIVCVERISGCSIGAFVSLLYVSNKLDLFEDIYEKMLKLVKTDHNFEKYKVILDNLRQHLPENVCEQMNNRVFINYYNTKTTKKRLKSHYKSVDDIFETITKSSFVPFVVNGNPTYKNKYIDGVNPYVFPVSTEKKALYVNLHSPNRTFGSINVKNEKTNFHRILTGVLEIHNFFVKDCRRTEMCSYVNDWSIIDSTLFYGIRGLIEKMVLYFVFYFVLLREFLKKNGFLSEKNILLKIFAKIFKETYIILLESYLI